MKRALVLVAAAALTSGCDATMSIMSPRGPWSGAIAGLWWIFLAVLSIIFISVMALLGVAVFAKQSGRMGDRFSERMGRNIVAVGAVVTPVIVVLGFLLADTTTGRTLNPDAYQNALKIQIYGQQWWWEAHYFDPTGNEVATTANEIHIPTRQPILLQLESKDVIHSFWVPHLNGKMDLIPGRKNRTIIQADSPGIFRGQCAEFCGDQHAHMALEVVAEPKEKFDAWLEHSKEPAPEPVTESQNRGRQILETGPCAMCHAVMGTDAGASVGPDLTHLASRRKIAAGTLPNNRGALAGWITNAQGVKPGVRMPRMNLSSDDLGHLLDYLETLR